MRFAALILPALAVIVMTACASGQGTATAPRDVITIEEIQRLNVSTAMEIVERLRPEFLRGRGRVSMNQPEAQFPVVYVNGLRAGRLEALRTITASDVDEIRYISAADATTRWGTGHTGGVIAVRIRS
jgi:hypothetical protein